jgi:hypothetical protein
MRRIQRNLALHPNGTYYLEMRCQGRQIRRSLETSNRREAKTRLRTELAKLKGERTEEPLRQPSSPSELEEVKALLSSLLAERTATNPIAERPSFSAAVEDHLGTIMADSKRTKEQYLTQKRKVLRLGRGWEHFDPAKIWTQVQEELRVSTRNRNSGWTHAPNHGASSLNMLVHYLRHLGSWLEVRGWLDPAAKHSLAQLKILKVNARRMEPPTEGEMATLIAQIKAEDYSYGAFIAFLAYTGCRMAGGLNALWSDWVDHPERPRFTFREKRRTTRTVDLTEQANALLIEIRSRGGIRAACAGSQTDRWPARRARQREKRSRTRDSYASNLIKGTELMAPLGDSPPGSTVGCQAGDPSRAQTTAAGSPLTGRTSSTGVAR